MSESQTACLECDLLLVVPALAEGERAACPRCGHHLMSRPRDGFARALAFAIAAVVFLISSCAFPFMAMKAGGLESQMTLPQSALQLYRDGFAVLAAFVLTFILIVPSAMLVAVLAVLVPLVWGQRTPWLVPAGRTIFTLTPWGMTEVFIIGVLVSLVKLVDLASIVLGISFWSYAAFTVCLTAALANLDRAYVWDAIERVNAR